jgi:hypothetical protein
MNPELVKLIALSQRSLQNIGAYVSISLALLAYSRFYRSKGNALYNIAFIVISAAVLLLSIRLIHLLLNQISMYKNKLGEEDLKVLDDFTIVPKTLMYVLYVILAFSLYTLYRQLL